MDDSYIFKEYKSDVFEIESDIDVFVTQVMSEETLATEWKAIRNRVAMRQVELDDEFERWNYYLFYVANVDVNPNLKYAIEHDTISSRKMVITAQSVDDELCDSLVRKYIKYDLENKETTFNRVFAKNDLVKRIVYHIKDDME